MAQPFPHYYDAAHPWKPRPAELYHGHGWYQGGHRRHRVKPHYHFVWPKDGKRNGTLGRFKDILKNQGPDIHVTVGADKNEHMFHRPRKSRWASWTHLDDRGPDGSLPAPFWVQPFRPSAKSYDFLTRKYQKRSAYSLSDALWPPGAGDRYPFPQAYRNVFGEWSQADYLPPWP